jgi:hypothetical protein
MQNKKNITSSSKLDDKHKHTTPKRIRYFQDTHTHTHTHKDTEREREREQFFDSAPVKNSERNLTAYAIFDRSTECMLIGSLSAQDLSVCVCLLCAYARVSGVALVGFLQGFLQGKKKTHTHRKRGRRPV